MDNWTKSLPRKGWQLEGIVDYEEPCHECEWCGTAIRYAHVLSHEDVVETTEAGCVCAEHLTDDYETPRRKEKEFKKKQRWLNSKKWKLSSNGSHYRKDCGIIIYQSGEYFKIKIGHIWGKKRYKTAYQAGEAAFDYLVRIGVINV